ncbi:hypothetical protein LXA43DRAFT_1059151 [Ganoderma leucocontextum]|nr:hypothetical protein LXA43DRAFT_1059151 [Ganoderma leucocontextum]
MAVHGIGSFSEPIVVSDEEDAAFVENELSRLTDSSSSSAYNSPPYDNNTPYLPRGPSPPPVPLELFLGIAPATPTSPVLGQKRKWTDMRDSTQAPQAQHPADTSNGKQKKKKQRKERQAQQYGRNQTSSATGGPSKQPHRSIATNVSHDVSRTFHPDDYSAMPPIMHLPYDAYQGYLPMDPYPIHAGFPFSPTDEYHPTDDLAIAVPHRESGSETSLSSPVASLLEGPFDSNLSERLRQLEALSASLLALTNGPSSSTSTSARATGPPRLVSPPMPSHPSHPPTRSQAVGRSSFAELPAKPAVPAPETLKRMIGIPDDRCKFGHFDLAAHHLEPPPPAKVAPPIPAHTIVLAQIPKKFRNKEFVRPWAKRFGNALRISLDVRAGKALVEWGSPAAAEAAFTSMRLRGDGKEHIRAYRYIGVKNSRAKEIEEGEIEEGELVETKAKKKKKTKGKTKAQPEQRPTRAAAPAPARGPLHVNALPLAPLPARPYAAAAPPAPTHESPPHLPPARLVNGAVAAPPDVDAVIAAATALGPVLERISHRPAAVRPMPEAGEEAMELDSDVEEEKAFPPSASTTASNVASGGEVEVEAIKVENESEGVVEEDMDVEDEDMVMSSPIGGPPVTLVPEPSPPPRLPETPTPAVPAPPPPADDEVAQAAQAARDARRRKLEEAIARTKAQLALRESALSSRPLLVSSSDSSESPDPPTPVDSPHVRGIEVAVASADGDMVDSDPVEAADVVVKTESAAVTLDDLAVSFITESIQTVSASSSTTSAVLSQQRPATSSTTMLASVQLAAPTPIPRPNAIPIVAPVPTPKVAVMPPPAAPTPLTEEQKLAKQKKWFELVSGSKSLMVKIATAKNKEEKSLLMRMLKAKTKAADELKREIDLGFALATTNPATTPSSTATSSSSSLSATPTPVPHSRTPSATLVPTPSGTPVPTPTPGSSILQKRWPSPPTVTSMSMFRWPETAREMIIMVSDDEAD